MTGEREEEEEIIEAKKVEKDGKEQTWRKEEIRDKETYMIMEMIKMKISKGERIVMVEVRREENLWRERSEEMNVNEGCKMIRRRKEKRRIQPLILSMHHT